MGYEDNCIVIDCTVELFLKFLTSVRLARPILPILCRLQSETTINSKNKALMYKKFSLF